MTTKLNRQAYEHLIREDLDVLKQFPRSLERDHIEEVLRASIDHEYPSWCSCNANLGRPRRLAKDCHNCRDKPPPAESSEAPPEVETPSELIEINPRPFTVLVEMGVTAFDIEMPEDLHPDEAERLLIAVIRGLENQGLPVRAILEQLLEDSAPPKPELQMTYFVDWNTANEKGWVSLETRGTLRDREKHPIKRGQTILVSDGKITKAVMVIRCSDGLRGMLWNVSG